MSCPVEFTRELSAWPGEGSCWGVNETQRYSATEMERMMKIQDVLLKAMAKKITWWAAAEYCWVLFTPQLDPSPGHADNSRVNSTGQFTY